MSFIARSKGSARSPISRSKSVFVMMSRVRCIMSECTSRVSPGRTPSTYLRAASTITAPYAWMRSRWKAGCTIRRCRSQKSPSLVTRPLPKSSVLMGTFW